MENYDQEFGQRQKQGGLIIISGCNLGTGSSR
jgi:3-isopropylmalate dehydratase small subunit